MTMKQSFVLGVIASTMIASGCGSDSGGSTTKSGSLVTGFGVSGVVTSNPSPLDSTTRAAVIVGAALYIVGTDQTTATDYQWRIEKRNLTDGSLDPAFGTGGVVTSNPSAGSDQPNAVATDGVALYVAGFDNFLGNARWRVEKRSLSDGALITAFGTNGVAVSNPSDFFDSVSCLAVDTENLYLVGSDDALGATNPQWRFEKRRLDTGALVTSFNGSGILVSNQSAQSEFVNSVVSSGTSLYASGVDPEGQSGSDRGRIEARSLTTGSLDTSFGTSGILSWDLSPSRDNVQDMALEANALYVIGYEESLGTNNLQWRIEKRSLQDGSVIWTRASNPSAAGDIPAAVYLDGDHLYVVGTDYSNGATDSQWRIEKRSTSDGELVTSFGTNGVVVTNPSSANDSPSAIVASGDYIFVIGDDRVLGSGDSQWRIEKRAK